MLPAPRNTSASAPWAAQSATFVLLTLPLLETVPKVRVIVAIAVLLLLLLFCLVLRLPQPAYQPSLHRRRSNDVQIDIANELRRFLFGPFLPTAELPSPGHGDGWG